MKLVKHRAFSTIGTFEHCFNAITATLLLSRRWLISSRVHGYCCMIEKLNVLVSVSFSGLPFHLKTIEIDQRGFSSLFFTISVFAKKYVFVDA